MCIFFFFVVITPFVTFFLHTWVVCAILIIPIDLWFCIILYGYNSLIFFTNIITGCILLEPIKWRHFAGSAWVIRLVSSVDLATWWRKIGSRLSRAVDHNAQTGIMIFGMNYTFNDNQPYCIKNLDLENLQKHWTKYLLIMIFI